MEDNIQTAKDLETHFLNHDNSTNLVLMSHIPDLCRTEPCLLGVDEAGRGPVLGPMVYGICFCPIDKAELLKELGCADSKSLTEEKREVIFEKLCNEQDSIGWAFEAISPNTICNSMLRRHKYSLNQVAQDSTVGLITKAIESGINVSEVYVDTVGMPDKYQITVAKKADAIYPIVSAASICAKVSRDRALKVWKFQEGFEATSEDFGSGYPNDPVTKTFLTKNIDPVFGFPVLVRFSWSTAGKILQERSAQVEWEDEEEDVTDGKTPSISAYFKEVGSNKRQKVKHKFFSLRNLTVMESLK
ncbi:Ribonuclease H2 subunit A [Blattella germanica]|nr:Ribonuclease H2 subunit A [Blattella germanica]